MWPNPLSTNPQGQEWLAGCTDIMPLLAGVIPFALLFGALAAQKGLSPAEVLLMSSLVYAGGAQFVAVEMWTEPVPVMSIIAATAMVNLRYTLMGAALAPAVAHLPRGPRLGFIAIHADETWGIALKRARQQRLSPAYIGGIVIPFYLSWLLWAVAGSLIGDALREPERYGFDFVFTAVFIVLTVGLWRGKSSIAPVLASALTAWLASRSLPGVWYIFLGAIAGALAGACSRANDHRRAV